MNRTDTSTINTGSEWITLRNRGASNYDDELADDLRDETPSPF